MTRVRDYFNQKYDKNGPAYLQGILRTIDKLPPADEEEDMKLKEKVLEK